MFFLYFCTVEYVPTVKSFLSFLSISSGTFFENYDIINRKLYISEHTALYENEQKEGKNI